MFMLSLYIGTYYNIILSWAFFYMFSSFTTSLPWASCGNWWNTAACTKFDSTNCTAHSGLMTRRGVSGNWEAESRMAIYLYESRLGRNEHMFVG